MSPDDPQHPNRYAAEEQWADSADWGSQPPAAYYDEHGRIVGLFDEEPMPMPTTDDIRPAISAADMAPDPGDSKLVESWLARIEDSVTNLDALHRLKAELASAPLQEHDRQELAGRVAFYIGEHPGSRDPEALVLDRIRGRAAAPLDEETLLFQAEGGEVTLGWHNGQPAVCVNEAALDEYVGPQPDIRVFIDEDAREEYLWLRGWQPR
jgi:hypothetical protein